MKRDLDVENIMSKYFTIPCNYDTFPVRIKDVSHSAKITAYPDFKTAEANCNQIIVCYIKDQRKFFEVDDDGSFNNIVPAVNYKLYMQMYECAETIAYIEALKKYKTVEVTELNTKIDNLLEEKMIELSTQLKKEWEEFYASEICDYEE